LDWAEQSSPRPVLRECWAATRARASAPDVWEERVRDLLSRCAFGNLSVVSPERRGRLRVLEASRPNCVGMVVVGASPVLGLYRGRRARPPVAASPAVRDLATRGTRGTPLALDVSACCASRLALSTGLSPRSVRGRSSLEPVAELLDPPLSRGRHRLATPVEQLDSRSRRASMLPVRVTLSRARGPYRSALSSFAGFFALTAKIPQRAVLR